MTKKITCFAMALALALNLFSVAAEVRAASWWDQASEGGLNQIGSQAYDQSGTPDENYDIRIMAARAIRVVLELLGVIFLVLIIVAGFRWMMAGGEEEKVSESKKQLSNGVIGLVIILVAYSIATYVFYRLQFVTTGVEPITWSW